MELQLRVIGFLLVVLALLHGAFARYFNWRIDFAPVSLINRQMMYVHTFFVAFMVLLMGLLCLTSAAELVGTPLGRRVALGCGVFWLARLLIQLFGYSPSCGAASVSKPLCTSFLSASWSYLSAVFLVVGLGC